MTSLNNSANSISKDIKDISNQTQGVAKKTSSIVANEFHNFVSDVENLFKATTSLTGEDLTRAKEKLYARIETAKDSASEISTNISRQARKTAEATNQYAHEKPWVVVGAGVAASFVVGYLLSRRK